MKATIGTIDRVFPPSPVPDEVRVAKKSPSRQGKADADQPGKRVSARLTPRIAQALQDFLDSQRPQPTDTAVLLTALEDFLIARGFLSREDEE